METSKSTLNTIILSLFLVFFCYLSYLAWIRPDKAFEMYMQKYQDYANRMQFPKQNATKNEKKLIVWLLRIFTTIALISILWVSLATFTK